MKTALSVTTEIKVPFSDVDMMGVVWHGNYTKYFEVARDILMNKINMGYIEMVKSGYLWPIVILNIKYIKPINLEQTILVSASVQEYENRLKIAYVIKDAQTKQKLCKGYSIQVAIEQKTGELIFQSPNILLKRIQDF
ncbi:MAG: acyl-CoA thioesterase [Candidatus Brocadiales bacterium]|nr:acyl-CoA thioesterase [Candidatus Brocadiales bacterium]